MPVKKILMAMVLRSMVPVGDGEDAAALKSGRRRGPLRRRRGQNGKDADTVEAADNNAGEALPEAVATGDAGGDETPLSAGASD